MQKIKNGKSNGKKEYFITVKTQNLKYFLCSILILILLMQFNFLLFRTLLLLFVLVGGGSIAVADELKFDFEDETAHRTSGTNFYSGSNSYWENDVEISLLYADAVTSGSPLSGTANAQGRVAKGSKNSPVVLIGPIPISTKTITGISYNTKGVEDMKMVVEYSLDNTNWTSLQKISKMPTSSTHQSITDLDISGNNIYLKFSVSVTTTDRDQHRDFQLDDIVFRLYG